MSLSVLFLVRFRTRRPGAFQPRLFLKVKTCQVSIENPRTGELSKDEQSRNRPDIGAPRGGEGEHEQLGDAISHLASRPGQSLQILVLVVQQRVPVAERK